MGEENAEQRIAEALRSKFGRAAPFEEHPGWRWQAPRQIVQPCTQCGSAASVWCIHADSGFRDFYDEYYHVCLECGGIDHRSSYGGMLGFERHAICPFCIHRWE
ncbi:hypothetical protein HY635_02130 [Candidatus Uhrbacteria bacterium]|nr:hypothetical protein [Candidatus Uhrbacteria bacterium]